MRLKSLEYLERVGEPEEWTLTGLSLGEINLLVGKNASGKSRILNVIHNLAQSISEQRKIFAGNSRLIFDNNGEQLEYVLEVREDKVVREIFMNECSPQQAAGYQNPKPPTRKTLEQLQLEFLTMKLLIDLFTPLLLHILANGFCIPMTSYRTDKIAFRPKFSTPQLLLHRRHPFKNLSGGQTFDHPDNLSWTIVGHRLDQEMHMIFVCANL